MKEINSVMIGGNLTRDIELRYLLKGTAVGASALALNSVYVTAEGEKKESTSFIDVKLWGRTAETAAQYLKKGDAVLFQGRLKQETWEDKGDGKTRSKVLVVVDRMHFLPNGKGGDGEGTRVPAARRAAPAAAAPADDGPMPEEDDSIPF